MKYLNVFPKDLKMGIILYPKNISVLGCIPIKDILYMTLNVSYYEPGNCQIYVNLSDLKNLNTDMRISNTWIYRDGTYSCDYNHVDELLKDWDICEIFYDDPDHHLIKELHKKTNQMMRDILITIFGEISFLDYVMEDNRKLIKFAWLLKEYEVINPDGSIFEEGLRQSYYMIEGKELEFDKLNQLNYQLK